MNQHDSDTSQSVRVVLIRVDSCQTRIDSCLPVLNCVGTRVLE